MKNIYWIYLNRLDEDISKAPRLEIADRLAEQNYSVTLLTSFRKKTYLPKKYHVKVIYFNGFNIKGLFKLFLSVNIFLWLMRNTLKNDIIIIPPGALWMTTPLQVIKKCKIHLDIRTIPVEINDIKSRIEYFIYWFMPLMLFNRSPDSYSFITELLKKNVEEEFNICFKDYVVWHSGVNLKHFAIVRKNLNINKIKKKFIVTYLGVVTKNRGLDSVIHAIYKLKSKYKEKIIFQIIGDGPYLRYLKQISSDLKINKNLIFKGYVPYESVPENLISTDCFICPLPERIEWNISSPIKIFEYFACAKPIILTPIIAHKTISNSKDFIIWTDGDKSSNFSEAIEYAFLNKNKLMNKARSAFDSFCYEYEWKSQGLKLSEHLANIT